MPRQEGQKLKLFRLLGILFDSTDEGDGVTMAQIIAELERMGIRAERKSLYNDFLALEELGFPIEKTPTRPPRYYLSERIFELAELKMLVDAVQSSKFITEERSRALIEKLKRFAGKHGARELSRTVYVEGRAKTVNNAVIYSIDELHRAINENKQIAFKYFSFDKSKKKVMHRGGELYRVSPLALIWRDENYYLVAYNEQSCDVRNYRVDKMQGVSACDVQRSEAALKLSVNSAEYSGKSFGMFRGEELAVTLECDSDMANVIVDRFGQEVTLLPNETGFTVHTPVIVSPQFFSWISGLGGGVRILSPRSVKEEFIAYLNHVIEKHGKKD